MTGPDPRWHAEAGRKGGRSRSPKKLAAVRRNARRGGRPRGLLVATSKDLGPGYMDFDRDTRDRLIAKLLEVSGRHVRLTVLHYRQASKKARLYISEKTGGRA